MESVANLARPTPGDKDFYNRWLEVGPVYTHIQSNYKSITVLVVDQRTTIDRAYLSKLPGVKYVVSATTGHTHLNFDPKECKVKLITLRNSPELESIRSVAEFTFKQMLTLARPNHTSGLLLSGKTIGIVGFGRIGRQVEKIAKAFQMTPLTYDKKDTLRKLQIIFQQSNFITIHLEENDETKGMIDKSLIGLSGGAYLINTSRPSIVPEASLMWGLVNGHLKGAAIDFPLSTFECPANLNLIVTPHIAGNTIEDRIKTDQIVLKKLMDLIRLRAKTHLSQPS